MNSAKQVKGTVLIIDDAISIIDLVKTALTENNYNVLIANSGKSGITSAIKSKPNLILLDILMPDMNGFETCEKLKSSKLTKDIPVLFMSASTETFDKVKAFKTGAVDYLTKPINIEELIARVETHVSLHIMQEKLKNTNQWLEKIVDERTQFLQDKNDEYENLNLELSKKNEKLQNTEKALRDRHEELQATEEELIASNDALKESIEQLYESEQRSTLLSDLNLEGIAIHRNGTILDVNNAFCKISGLSKEETIGFNPIPTMFHPDDLALVYKNIASKSTKAYTVRGFRKDRTPIWVEMESRNIIYKDEPIPWYRFRFIYLQSDYN